MTVQEFMMKSGAPMNLKGYELLKETIEKRIESPDKSVGEIMIELSRKHNCTSYAVEKNIKTVLLKAWPRMDKQLKDKLFINRAKVTLTEYIKSVAYAIRNKVI